MSNSYLDHHRKLLKQLRALLVAFAESEQIPQESHSLFLERYDDLLEHLEETPYLGQDLLTQMFQRYPQIAHLVPRDLLWFFGGDCLHFMPEEEIELYQQLDERRFAAEQRGESFNWDHEKQLLFLPNHPPAH